MIRNPSGSIKTVGDVVSPKLLSVRAETTLRDAAEIMRNDGVGSLLVHDQDKAVGVVTDRDMIVRSVAYGQDPNRTEVRQCMTPRVVTCGEDATLDEAAELMMRENVRRLVVCDENEVPMGMISVDDLAFHLRDDHLFHQTMRGVSHTGRAA